jgi:hypothetical protein
MFWNLVKPFLDPITRSKFTFVCGSDEQIAAMMSKEFDMEKVEDHFFGKKPSDEWSEEEYVKHCYAVEQRMREYYDRRADEIFNPKKEEEVKEAPEGEKKKKKSKNQRKKEKREE